MRRKRKNYIYNPGNLKYFFGLVLLAHLLSPGLAYANGMAVLFIIIVALPFLFFLILISAGLAAFTKFLLVKTEYGKKIEVSLGTLVGVAIREALIVGILLFSFYLLSSSRQFWDYIPLGVIDYILYVSDAIGRWSLQQFISHQLFFYWLVLLLYSLPIYFIFAILLNLRLLKKEEKQRLFW